MAKAPITSLYQPIVDFIIKAGDELPGRAGQVADIGVKKQWLTEDDIRIERGLKNLISGLGSDHAVYAEEENEEIKVARNVWVIDPISGTHNYVQGNSGYSVVFAHVEDGEIRFAAVYDPENKKLFTAAKGQGAFINGTRLNVRQPKKPAEVILRISMAWRDQEAVEKVKSLLSSYTVSTNMESMALNYCSIAEGKYDGIISLSKDSFPEFAGSLIVQEAGGKFTNLEGQEQLKFSDRVFVAGYSEIQEQLLGIASSLRK
jgi:myo-inositol-1(or 4)-monophosphatase